MDEYFEPNVQKDFEIGLADGLVGKMNSRKVKHIHAYLSGFSIGYEEREKRILAMRKENVKKAREAKIKKGE